MMNPTERARATYEILVKTTCKTEISTKQMLEMLKPVGFTNNDFLSMRKVGILPKTTGNSGKKLSHTADEIQSAYVGARMKTKFKETWKKEPVINWGQVARDVKQEMYKGKDSGYPFMFFAEEHGQVIIEQLAKMCLGM